MTVLNWSENVEFSFAPIYAPQTMEELQELVLRQPQSQGARRAPFIQRHRRV